VDSVLAEGLKAYALEQTHREAKACDQLKQKWAAWRERGQLYLARETPQSDKVVMPKDHGLDGDEDDDEDEEGAPDYEDEEEDAVE
jgi:hypothetical protein